MPQLAFFYWSNNACRATETQWLWSILMNFYFADQYLKSKLLGSRGLGFSEFLSSTLVQSNKWVTEQKNGNPYFTNLWIMSQFVKIFVLYALIGLHAGKTWKSECEIWKIFIENDYCSIIRHYISGLKVNSVKISIRCAKYHLSFKNEMVHSSSPLKSRNGIS